MNEQEEHFAHNLAELLATWRLPRATGRTYAVLLLSETPLTLDVLQTKTGLSKGQTSTSVRELTSWGLALSTTRSGTRRLWVEAQAGIDTLIEASNQRARLFIDTLREGGTIVPPASHAGTRLTDLISLFDHVSDG